MADALQAAIGAAPEQWYNFKPIWPATREESLALERRAAAALAGRGPASVETTTEPLSGPSSSRQPTEPAPAAAPEPS
jgi:hypothetical protein